MEFTYDGGGIGKGGSVVLFVDGAEGVVKAALSRTHRFIFSMDETLDVGCDVGSAGIA